MLLVAKSGAFLVPMIKFSFLEITWILDIYYISSFVGINFAGIACQLKFFTSTNFCDWDKSQSFFNKQRIKTLSRGSYMVKKNSKYKDIVNSINNLAGENFIGKKFHHRSNVWSRLTNKAFTSQVYSKLLH